jgi:hypothetical protein
MAINRPRRSYYGVQVTLTSADTNYEIYTLVEAIVTVATNPSDAPGACREFNIQSDPGNDGSNPILVGDSELSATRYGYSLSAGDSRVYRSDINNVQVAGKYVRSHASGQKLNVEIDLG